MKFILEKPEKGLWKEIQADRKVRLQKKIDEYVDSFTTHGLTKGIKGTRIESIFWLVMLISGILLCFVVLYGLVSKFLSRAVYTEIRSQITDRNLFPSITFCEKALLIDSYFAYCGVAPRFPHKNNNESCNHSMIPNWNNNVESERSRYWSNGYFNVSACSTWGGKKCDNDKYFKSINRLNHSCITWNYKGDFFDIYSHTDIKFKFNKPMHLKEKPSIIAIPHDPEIQEIDITAKIDIDPFKQYEIKLDKTIIKRLPAPFPANCTNDKVGDIFPGKYSRHSCIETFNYLNMYKVCGDTIDYVRQYIPTDIIKKYKQTKKIRDVVRCMTRYSSRESKHSLNCRFPCNDLDLSIVSTVQEGSSKLVGNETVYRLSIQFQRVDTYKIMEEKELYTWDQMACEIGGFIGLVIGMSILSLIEIIVYIVLLIARKLI